MPNWTQVINNSTMDEERKRFTINIGLEAVGKLNIEKDVARYIKTGMDNKYGPCWHVIVGKNFGRLAFRIESIFLDFIFQLCGLCGKEFHSFPPQSSLNYGLQI